MFSDISRNCVFGGFSSHGGCKEIFKILGLGQINIKQNDILLYSLSILKRCGQKLFSDAEIKVFPICGNSKSPTKVQQTSIQSPRKPYNLFILLNGQIFRIIQLSKLLVYNLNFMQESSEVIITRPGDLQDQTLDIQTVQSTKGQQIISCSISHNRKYILITTQKGFLICYVSKSTAFRRFQNEQSPFFVSQKHPCGVKSGFIFEQKPQVAIVPAFNSKKYKQTSIYVYNYSAKIILMSFDMVLPIKQFKMTEKYIICSNNKRILVYNYLQSALEDDERFYLNLHESKEKLDFIRYLDMKCHRYQATKQCESCECGRFQSGREMKIYLKLFFVKVQQNKSTLNRSLYVYDEITDKVKPFEQLKTLSNDFNFKVTEDAKYMLVSEDSHRKIKVFNLEDNCNFISLLYLSHTSGAIINLGVIQHPVKGQYVIASREKGGDQATMHLFQLKNSSLIQPLQSKYKRYFRLYKTDTQKKDVFAENVKFLGPEYYMVEGKLICLSMQGQQCELIDLNRTGLHDRANASSYSRIEEII